MTPEKQIRCAIYTRKSSEEGLDQSFNSLHAQREACEAYVLSQKHEGWAVIASEYDDGGFSGGNMERPGLRKLLNDIAAKRIDTVLVYKVDRLTRSLIDFAKIVEQFDGQGVSFVSVTQQFNTTSSMGRLTLNVLLSFAQFEREVTGERIRDKIAASKRKGMWMGGAVPIGYNLKDRQLIVNEEEAARVREIYRLYLELGCVSKLQVGLDAAGIRSKKRLSKTGHASGNVAFSRGALYELLQNPLFLGQVRHKNVLYPGQHPGIVNPQVWEQAQKQLANSRIRGVRLPTSAERSILTGLLFDEDGNRFVPSHTTKKGRRYRYYVSQTLCNNPQGGAARPLRLPAEQLETLIECEMDLLYRSPEHIAKFMSVKHEDAIEMSMIVKALAVHNRMRKGLTLISPKLIARILVGQRKLTIFVQRNVP